MPTTKGVKCPYGLKAQLIPLHMPIIRENLPSRPSVKDISPFPINLPVDPVLWGDIHETTGARPTLDIDDRSKDYRITERDITEMDSREDVQDYLESQGYIFRNGQVINPDKETLVQPITVKLPPQPNPVVIRQPVIARPPVRSEPICC